MDKEWIQSALALVTAYGYPFLFLASFVENVVILGLFVPGDALAILGGAACAEGVLEITPTFLAVFSGVGLGAVFSYAVGARGGVAFIARWGERARITRERIDAATRYFERHGQKTVLVGCFVSGLKNLVPAIAGASRMAFARFLVYGLAATALRSAGLVAAGYLLAASLDRAIRLVHTLDLAVALVFVVLLAGWIVAIWLRRDRRRSGRRQ